MRHPGKDKVRYQLILTNLAGKELHFNNAMFFGHPSLTLYMRSVLAVSNHFKLFLDVTIGYGNKIKHYFQFKIGIAT